jgi:tetratricopeptide (TPR) repeat protein
LCCPYNKPVLFSIFRILVITGIVLVPFFSCFALDWKVLHDKAETLSSEQALAAVAERPGSGEDLYVLALVYLGMHKDSEAQGIFGKMKTLDPVSVEAAWGEAELLRRKHELEKSDLALQDIIDAQPDFVPAYISRAYVKYLRQDFNASVDLASAVLAMGREKVDKGNYMRAYLIVGGGKGMIAHYGGPLSKIINGRGILSTLKKAESLNPDDAEVLFGLGSYYLLAPALVGGDIDKGLDHLERAVKADPLRADGYVRLAQAYKMKGNKEKYQAYLKQALEIDPGSELALDIKNGTCKFICVGNN